MAETFVWPEGAIYLWTGTATASAIPAYAEYVQGTFMRGWENYATLDGVWHNVQTGQRADITLGTLYTMDNEVIRAMEGTATAVHMELRQSSINGTAGYVLYSGRIDMMALAGREGDTFKFSLSYHANEWSAYG
jgi:hypothetical protein